MAFQGYPILSMDPRYQSAFPLNILQPSAPQPAAPPPSTAPGLEGQLKELGEYGAAGIGGVYDYLNESLMNQMSRTESALPEAVRRRLFERAAAGGQAAGADIMAQLSPMLGEVRSAQGGGTSFSGGMNMGEAKALMDSLMRQQLQQYGGARQQAYQQGAARGVYGGGALPAVERRMMEAQQPDLAGALSKALSGYAGSQRAQAGGGSGGRGMLGGGRRMSDAEAWMTWAQQHPGMAADPSKWPNQQFYQMWLQQGGGGQQQPQQGSAAGWMPTMGGPQPGQPQGFAMNQAAFNPYQMNPRSNPQYRGGGGMTLTRG